VGGNVQIVHAVAKDIWPIRVDINELELALVNLGINARDAMPNGGVITIAAENVSLTGSDNPDRLSGDFVRVSIADTGCGIPAETFFRAFSSRSSRRKPSTRGAAWASRKCTASLTNLAEPLPWRARSGEARA
jgi:signal transduction histidine kinase